MDTDTDTEKTIARLRELLEASDRQLLACRQLLAELLHKYESLAINPEHDAYYTAKKFLEAKEATLTSLGVVSK